MAQTELKEITLRATKQFNASGLRETAMMLVAQPPVGTEYWPACLNRRLFKGDKKLAKEWYIGEFVKGRQLVCVNDEAYWDKIADLGSGLLRAVASQPRQARIALATVPAWAALDSVLKPYTDGERDGLPISSAPRYTLPQTSFKSTWAELLIHQIFSGRQEFLAFEQWTVINNRVTEFEPDNVKHEWWYATPLRMCDVAAFTLGELSSAWDPPLPQHQAMPQQMPPVPVNVAPDQRDENGYVVKPLDKTAYVSKKTLLDEYCTGTELDTDRKLTRVLEVNTMSIRQWRPRRNRLNVHLNDWQAHVEGLKLQQTGGREQNPSPSQIQDLKESFREQKLKDKRGK